MDDIKELIDQTLHSSAHLSKRHIHPRLAKMFELGGMTAVFDRAEGPYLYDTQGRQFLDFLAGGGVYFIGRNHPHVNASLRGVLDLDAPNLCIVNASVLGGTLAERLLGHAGPHYNKVIYANSGTEATDVCVRFARFVTGKRRFLYLEGAFHGRSYAAISMCGFPQMKEGMDPVLPTVTPIKPNDLRQLRREMKMGDVAGVFMEPVQGMTCTVMDPGFLREAELLCEQHGAVFIADEVQTGLGRTGSWFATTGMGVRPGMMTVSKTLSGGQMPVACVLFSEEIYERVYAKFSSGPLYFSTFAENNLAMAAGLATLDVLEDMDAPAEAERKGRMLREGVEKLAQTYDVIDHVEGKGLMMAVYFRDSSRPALLAQQRILQSSDNAAFAAAVNVSMYRDQQVIVQIPGPGLNAIKILPPVVSSDADIERFLSSFEETLANLYGRNGPVVSLGKGLVNNALKRVREVIPEQYVPPALQSLAPQAGDEKKKSSRADRF